MSIIDIAIKTSKVVVASYRTLTTLILGYYLIKETIRREKDGRKHHYDVPSPNPEHGGGRNQAGS